MKNTKIQIFTLLAFCVTLLSVTSANAQFENAAKWVPENANCLVMVQAENILNSAIGRRENWATDRSAAFRSGASFFPPTTKRILMGSQIDFEFLDSVYHVGVFEKKGSEINLVEVSKRVNGNIATIGGKQALELPNNSYLIKVDNTTLVTMTPSNRQMTTRWLAKTSNGKMRVSPYLAEAVKFADQNAQVIVAFDLEGVLDPAEVEKRLVSSGAVLEVSAAAVTKTLSTLRGVTLGVTVNDKISGAIKIDFSSDPSNVTPVSKAILIAALKKNGLMIDDIASWNVSSSGNQILLSGPMTSEGFRQIGSLVHQPLEDDMHGASGSVTSSAEPTKQNMATKTKQYLGDIDHILEIQRKKKEEQLDTYAKWFDRYARQIDGISILGVDPIAIDFGTYVGNAFRDISGDLNTSDLSKNEAVSSQGFSGPGGGRWNYGYGYGYGYGTINGRNYTRDSRRNASALGTEKGMNQKSDTLRQIDAKESQVKRALTEKYQINF
ncbi:hypothetical protein N9061_02555 [bacterium]|jgi:hypothetical protein|nr:hypothetical protein [bacterium]MDB4372766.1 hypothetical protein [Mariniblastus sp.]MDB4484005.1 hypothetical protein [bacterium]